MTRRSYISARLPRSSGGRKPKVAERDVLRACLDLLAAKRIRRYRMQAGAWAAIHRGKSRMVRFGVKGMADIMALVNLYPVIGAWGDFNPRLVLWIETKSAGSKQSDAQRMFQEDVTADGDAYLLVSDVDTLAEWLKSRGL